MLNRGVDKRNIYITDADRARFVHDLWEFNDTENANNVWHRVSKNKDLRNPYVEKERIVDLHGWCLMDNHYHLLLSERLEGGLTKFIRRLNVGYANYFNETHDRQGTLFQGRTKKILIEHDAHFLHILNYIHLNPLDTLSSAKEWRGGKIKSAQEALKTLSTYRWSSYLDYNGQKNFPSILTTELFEKSLGQHKRILAAFLNDLQDDTEHVSRYSLE